jgi:hypothetical protein
MVFDQYLKLLFSLNAQPEIQILKAIYLQLSCRQNYIFSIDPFLYSDSTINFDLWSILVYWFW